MAQAQSYTERLVSGGPDRALRHFTDPVSRRIVTAVKRMQYGRMQSILDQMPDHHLDAIGIRRSEIAAYSYQLVYGTDSAQMRSR